MHFMRANYKSYFVKAIFFSKMKLKNSKWWYLYPLPFEET